MDGIWVGVLMGLGGTLAMDVWAWILARLGGAPFPNWAMPGRWLAHIPRGQVFHDDIGAANGVPGELGLGWGLHYGVGILYGIVFALAAGAGWLSAPTFLPLWIYSIVLVGAGWFLLQPGMGLGFAASKTPNPWKVRILNIVAHTVFALGMWGGAVMVA